MKIAIGQHITASYWGGGEKEMFELALGLRSLGNEVDVYALPYTLEGKRKIDIYSRFKQNDIGYHENLFHLIRADVLYSLYHPFSYLSYITRAPTITSFHSMGWFNQKEKRKGYGLVPRTAFTLNDHLMNSEMKKYQGIHVHDDSTKAEVVKRAPEHPPITVIEHFVDTETFKPNGGKAKEFTVLFVGRPVWQKGFDRFKQMATELGSKGIKFQFIGGNAEEKNIESLGLITDTSRVAKIMSDAHLLLIPQRVQTMGKSSLESLACGTAVLITAQINPPIGRCSALLTASDYDDMKTITLSLRNQWQTGEYEKYIECARRCVLENYSYDATIKRYEEMFRRILVS